MQIARGSAEVSLRTLGKKLAWDIYRRYSRHGKSVDIISHSMGGLIARAALTGVERKLQGWPPYLYVEDVATLGTPHAGAAIGYACLVGRQSRQCKQMRPGSAFLNWAAHNPQSTQGTDWTLIGARDDGLVGMSALRMRGVGHRVWYNGNNPGWNHGSLNEITTGRYRMVYENPPATAVEDPNGAAPARAAMNSLYWWRNW
ncbi:esterase/lipase family protein [Streptomyces prasinus]